MNNNFLIEINNLSFKYQNSEHFILKEINLKIEQNNFISILGKNGSGKTTLAKLIAGNLENYIGDILINGKNLRNIQRKELSKIVSYLPQIIPENIPFSVFNLILMGRYPYRNLFENYNNEDINIAKKYLKLLDLENYKNNLFDQLSGGEKRRVLLAQTLSSESQILILDEPEAFIDIPHKISLYNYLKILNEKYNKTIILISHDLNLAFKYSKRIIFIAENRIFYDIENPEKLDKNIIRNIFNIEVQILKIDNRPYLIY
ncbi:MAG: ABC transporter ATP-binding protein [Spirochaetes bacterium]|nr:ABC transporter ATP-binding protein [Spirochaetota bacterium]